MTWWLTSGLPRQFWLMKANSRCSILFHLLVPGGRWQTVIESQFVGEALQFAFPEFHPGAVAAAAVGRDRQTAGLGIARQAQLLPPAPDTLDREGRRIGIDADADPAMVGGDVVDSIGRHLAQFGDLEIMHPHRFGLTLRTQLPAGVLEVANKLFFLRVDRNRRLASRDRGFHLAVDISNCASRSGCSPPSRVFWLAWQLYFRSRSRFATTR